MDLGVRGNQAAIGKKQKQLSIVIDKKINQDLDTTGG